MKSCFLCVTCLFVVFTAISMGCDPHTGPAGVSRCFLGTPDYSKYQCGTCLTDAYIRQRSKGKHACEDTTITYCYYQCMIEKHGLDEGPVYDDCLCEANRPLPQPPVILPASCYSPDGTDCNWYSQCLARMYDCSGQADYAIQYGEKYCKIYRQSQLALSSQALRWIDAVRKCLQVALVPLVHLCQERYTCKSVEKAAFDSHATCYLSPYQGFSVCLLPVSDWLRIFWTIKGSYHTSAFLKTMKSSAVVAANCRSEGFRAAFENALYALDVLVWGRDINKDDELAHSIVLDISSSLRWNQRSTVDWYAFAADTSAIPSAEQSGTEVRIQLFMVDLVDIGLTNADEAAGRRRLDESIDQLADDIREELTGTVGDLYFGVTSLRRCTSGDQINTGCSNGRLLAKGFPSSPPPDNGGIKAVCIMHWLFAIAAFLLY